MTTALQCRCDYPGCLFPAQVRRQLTQYHKEESNWACLCLDHQTDEDDYYWNERWADYYADVGFPYVTYR